MVAAACSHGRARTWLRLSPAKLEADGVSLVTVRFHPPEARIELSDAHAAGIVRRAPGLAYLRAGVTPAEVRVRAVAPGGASAVATLVTTLHSADSFGDGTPDFLRLSSEDQQAFRRWFTFLAEAQYYRNPAAVPKEINDCAALLRYAYREALSVHSSAWANRLGIANLLSLPPVQKYAYPFTPLGANLFRVRPGPFRPDDLAAGAFAQFAGASTLERWNCHFVSRDLRLALPGDLLFFKQIAEPSRLPFHSMIFLGASRVEPSAQSFVLYHTGGPEGIRRLTVEEMIGYPLAEWRPIPGNENFLGVFRWNILR